MIKLKFKYMYMLYYCLYKADFGYRKINRHNLYGLTVIGKRGFFIYLFFFKTPYNVSNSLLVTNTKNATDD